MEYPNRIRELREARGITQAQLASAMGIDNTALSRIERGLRQLTDVNIKKAANELRVTPQEIILDNAHIPSEHVDEAHPSDDFLPFAGYVEAGALREIEHVDQRRAPRVNWMPNPRFSKARQFAWQVRGDSMNLADIHEDWFVSGVLYEDYVNYGYGDVQDGDIVIIEVQSGDKVERTLKRVRIFRDRTEFRPESSNAEHKPIIAPRDADLLNFDHGKVVAIVTAAFKPLIR